jgi:hypothetical protein
MLNKYNLHKPLPGPASMANAGPAQAAPVLRGEGGAANDDAMIVEAILVIHPPRSGREFEDDEIKFVG